MRKKVWGLGTEKNEEKGMERKSETERVRQKEGDRKRETERGGDKILYLFLCCLRTILYLKLQFDDNLTQIRNNIIRKRQGQNPISSAHGHA